MGGLFSEMIVLDETDLFSLHFEIFLLRFFTGEDGGIARDQGTACLSLGLLFNLEPLSASTPTGGEHFHEHAPAGTAPGRVRHERDLRLAIHRIAEEAGSLV